jgi:hypothetical protein
MFKVQKDWTLTHWTVVMSAGSPSILVAPATSANVKRHRKKIKKCHSLYNRVADVFLRIQFETV